MLQVPDSFSKFVSRHCKHSLFVIKVTVCGFGIFDKNDTLLWTERNSHL